MHPAFHVAYYFLITESNMVLGLGFAPEGIPGYLICSKTDLHLTICANSYLSKKEEEEERCQLHLC